MRNGCRSGRSPFVPRRTPLLDDLGRPDRTGSEQLRGYQPFPAARADLLHRLGRHSEAAAAYRDALALPGSEPDRRYLRRRLDDLGSPPHGRRRSAWTQGRLATMGAVMSFLWHPAGGRPDEQPGEGPRPGAGSGEAEVQEGGGRHSRDSGRHHHTGRRLGRHPAPPPDETTDDYPI